MKKKFRRFAEYLDAKDKLQEKPIVDLHGDTVKSSPPNPPKDVKKGKDWNATTPDYPANPYKAVGISDSNKVREKGLGNIGDKNLIYKPEVIDEVTKDDDDNFSFPKEKVSSVWTASEAFIAKTKNMGLREFVDYIQKPLTFKENSSIPKVHANQTGEFLPDPIQVIKYIGYLTSSNNKLMETLVAEIKRTGGLHNLVKSTLEHNASYAEIAKALTLDKKALSNSRMLAASLAEVTAPPAKDTEDTIHEKKKKEKRKNPSEGRKTSTIAGDNLDMGDQGNTEIKSSTALEHTIIKALHERKLI